MTSSFTQIQAILDNDNIQNRNAMRKHLVNPIFTPRFDISLNQERQDALEKLQSIANNKFISVYDFKNNPLNILAVHEMVGMVDGSTATKLVFTI